MSLPLNLLLVRHGQSESNVLVEADQQGDTSLFTEEMMTVPDRLWCLTEQGRKQAHATGEWLQKSFPTFDRYWVSPFNRTRETAALLDLQGAHWEENRLVRERSWGEIASIKQEMFRENYQHNATLKKYDPLYWCPPAGESIASIVENRVRNLKNTLYRECSDQNVIIVSHGEFMRACQIEFERWTDEEFIEAEHNESLKIRNCTALQYTRFNPNTNTVSHRFQFVRMITPVLQEDGSYKVQVGDWREFHKTILTNEDLLVKVAQVEPHL